MRMISFLNEDINDTFDEIQKPTGKQVEPLREEKSKSCEEIEENTI